MTDDIERSLGDQLRAAAGTVHATPDADDLLQRVHHRHRRRQQLLGGALAAALVAGPFVGAAVERASAPDAAAVASGPAGEGTDGAAALDERGRLPGPTYGGTATAERGASDAAIAIDGDGYVPQPFDSLGSATVDGVTFRLFAENYPAGEYGDTGWTPPAECQPAGSLIAQVSNDVFVGSLYAERWMTGDVVSSFGVYGIQEGDPRWLLVGSFSPGATVTFPDGSTGVVGMVGEWVVATAPMADGFEPYGATGEELTATVDGVAIPQWSPGPQAREDFDWRICEPPPPPLPEPGEQPADPEQARSDIGAAFESAYDSQGSGTPEDRARLVELEAVAVEAYRYLAGSETPLDGLATGARTGEIVFVTPDHTVLHYHLLVDGNAVYNERIGEARLVDGTWRVAAQTFCTDVSIVGAPCWEFLERHMAESEMPQPAVEPDRDDD